MRLSAPPATRRAVAPGDRVEGARVERERQPRRAARPGIRVDRDAGRELPGAWVTGDAEQRLEGVEQGDQARGLQAAGAAEHGLVGEPGQRVVEERDGEQHAARAVGAGGAEQAERVEGAVDHRAGGRVEVADDLQHDARELGGRQARERAGDLAGVGVGPQAQLLRRPAAGRVAAHDQRRGRPAGEHELDAAGDRRARAAERDLAARGAGRVEREAPRPGHDAGVGRGGRARHGQPASRRGRRSGRSGRGRR